MLNRYITICLLTFYFYLSGFTGVSGDVGQGISGRVTYADYYMLLVMAVAFLVARKINYFPNFGLYVAFLLAMMVSLIFAQNPGNGWIEILVHAFNFFSMMAIFNLLTNTKDLTLSDIIRCFLYATVAIAVLGILQFMVFPSWFAGSQVGGLVGTFRNTGQAGTFFGMSLAVFIPAMAAGVLRKTPLNIVGIALIILCMLMTVKRASILGFSIGITGLLFVLALNSTGADRKRNFLFVLIALVAIPVIAQIVSISAQNVEGLDWRFERKIQNFTVQGFMDNFFGGNISGALKAFSDSPLLGVGPGNIIGEYTETYEIHSTPFSILSSTGIVGSTVYIIFLLHWFFSIWSLRGKQLVEEKFLLYFLPFLVGLIVSWGYTYHIRKREFWILYAIVAYAAFLIQKYRSSATKQNARRSIQLRRRGYRPQPT